MKAVFRKTYLYWISLLLVFGMVICIGSIPVCAMQKANSDFNSESTSITPEILCSGDFRYVILSDDTIRIVEYIGDSEAAIIIPAEIDDRRVTAIGYRAFHDCHAEVLTMPASITQIDSYAFDYDDITKIIYTGSYVDFIQIDMNENERYQLFPLINYADRDTAVTDSSAQTFLSTDTVSAQLSQRMAAHAQKNATHTQFSLAIIVCLILAGIITLGIFMGKSKFSSHIS